MITVSYLKKRKIKNIFYEVIWNTEIFNIKFSPMIFPTTKIFPNLQGDWTTSNTIMSKGLNLNPQAIKLKYISLIFFKLKSLTLILQILTNFTWLMLYLWTFFFNYTNLVYLITTYKWCWLTIDPSLVANLSIVKGFVFLARYTYCSAASTDRLFTIGSNANETTQIWESDASTFLTAAL